MKQYLNRVVLSVLLALSLIVSAGLSNIYAEQKNPCAAKNPCAKVAATHSQAGGVKYLKEAINHLEEAVKEGGDAHVKEALDHAKEALKHAEASGK